MEVRAVIGSVLLASSFGGVMTYLVVFALRPGFVGSPRPLATRRPTTTDRRPTCGYPTSNNPAAPIPPPTHIVTTTYFAPRRLPSISAWPVIRAPDMP